MFMGLHFASRSQPSVQARELRPLERVVLTDQVGRSLFAQYAQHRRTDNGEQETGWLLVGHREIDQAIVLAALPAGIGSDAGVAHIRFNSTVQAIACRLLRQRDRRLNVLGVVHTHPGSLRHPSDWDLRGDRVWVEQLRGRQGIFGIGTADVLESTESELARNPRFNVQCLGELRFSWYTLTAGARRYRPVPVSLTLGPDLLSPLQRIWPTLDHQADRLERLLQQVDGRLDVHDDGLSLRLSVRLPESQSVLRVLLTGPKVRYYLERGEELLAVDLGDNRVDRGVYLLLAELAGSG